MHALIRQAAGPSIAAGPGFSGAYLNHSCDAHTMENLPEFIANHLFLVSLFIGLLSLLLWNIFGTTVSGVAEISPMEVTRLMNHEKAVVLDVRPEKNYAEGHVLNAINIPPEKSDAQADVVKQYREQPVILFADTAPEAVRVARLLKQQGFMRLYTLKGGAQSWRTANLPLLRDSTTS